MDSKRKQVTFYAEVMESRFYEMEPINSQEMESSQQYQQHTAKSFMESNHNDVRKNLKFR